MMGNPLVMLATSQSQNFETDKTKRKKSLFVIIGLLGFAAIILVVLLSIPSIQLGFQSWSEYMDLTWAHQENLIQVLINFSLMMWLFVSTFFFGGWMLNRSIRKFRGKSWSIATDNPKRKKFFPPILPYLKLSCLFLLVVLLFVILQYPLQFIM